MTPQKSAPLKLSVLAVRLATLALLAGCANTLERGEAPPPRSTAVTVVSTTLTPPRDQPATAVLTPAAFAATEAIPPPSTPPVMGSYYPETNPDHALSVRRGIASAPDCQLPCWWGLSLGDTERDVVSKLNERGIAFVASRLKGGVIDQINVSEMEGSGQRTGGRIDILFDFSSTGRLTLISVLFESSRSYASQFWTTDNLTSVLRRPERAFAVRVYRPIPMFKADRLPVELNMTYSTVNGSTGSLTIASTVEALAYSKARAGERCAIFDFDAPEQAKILIQPDHTRSAQGATPPPSQYEVFEIALDDFASAMRDSKPRLCW